MDLRHPAWLSLLLLFVTTEGVRGQALHDPVSHQCNQGNGELPEVSQVNTYVAGGMMSALVSLPKGVSGVSEFYLCPEVGSEECLARVPLQLADGSGTQFNLANVPGEDKYQVPLIIPDEITCDLCTLQLRVSVDNCNDKVNCQVSETFRCSYISVHRLREADKRRLRFSKRRGRRPSFGLRSGRKSSGSTYRRRKGKQPKRDKGSRWRYVDHMNGILDLFTGTANLTNNIPIDNTKVIKADNQKGLIV